MKTHRSLFPSGILLLALSLALGGFGTVFADSAEDLMKQALQAESPAAKRAIYEKVLTTNPEHYIAQNNIASTYESEGNLDQAAGWYEKAIRTAEAQGKPYALAHFGLADVYFARENYSKAWANYQAGLKIDSTDAQALARTNEIKQKFPGYFDSQGNFLLKDSDEIVQAANHPAFRSLSVGEDVEQAMKSGKTRAIVVQPKVQLTILFDYDSDKIRDESKLQLKNLGQAINAKEMSDFSFYVDGHTDSQGSNDYNQKLSQRRAKAVKDFLSGTMDITPDRLVERGFGEDKLMAVPEKTPDDQQKNRRVEVMVKGRLQ
ncbi:MAG TPA: OmpA family protein [Candidatus Ozemobacteraceae bacterium]|nr:OmpA family protein [Candidatus Ozemobacteraceae bacterium]